MSDTPNKNEIDRWEEQIQEEYQYEKLKDCDLGYLRRKDPDLKAKVLIFKSSFPHQKSEMTGLTRVVGSQDSTNQKEPLTNTERNRISSIQAIAERELHRAIEFRKEQHRVYRSWLLDSVVRFVHGVGNVVPW